jgi:glutamine synthetase
MKDIPALFGSLVFNDAAMREWLPATVYSTIKEAVSLGKRLELETANVVAAAMKDWAVQKGATHYAHWFQPMTGVTAGKHDGFITPAGDGKIVMEFKGSELIHGEPDASSLPSGGLRSIFEARGYTVWDMTSNAFVKDGTLFIPTAYCSYGGEALDMKTPLLRSMEAIERQALRVLRLFGNQALRVFPTIGAEQEFFLIDKEIYRKRPDLVYTGRTLFGAKPPKGQELEDHYFGILKPRVTAFMKELEEELWKLGVYVKTRHNESAPAQHEIVPVFITAGVATDHNQLTMELAQSVADRHGLACLLHEKPFAGINGSGKHINYSLSTDTGMNLLEPGDTPHDNAQFLLFFTAMIKAVDTYQDLLRASVASAGNDHRLGAGEAPPAIVSVFLGEELTGILEALGNDTEYREKANTTLKLGVTSLPRFPRDVTDRNRTSPLAFTGNKFEFRMPGASLSVAGPVIALNAAVSESLCGFADTLEHAGDFHAGLLALVQDTVRRHKRIIFNGNNYAQEWTAEANRRGLSRASSAVDALAALTAPESVALFERHRVFTKAELQSRHEMLLETYVKTIRIEAMALIDMVQREVVPACVSYQLELTALLAHTSSPPLMMLSERISSLLDGLLLSTGALKDAAVHWERILDLMAKIRLNVDELESLVAKKHWPLPTYAEILYSVAK